MNTDHIRALRKQLKKELDAKRYEHTLGVAYTAASLAMAHGADAETALLAGLLHDCAKCVDNREKIRLCEESGVPIREVERRNPYLLHAGAGARLAFRQYGITNEDILNAIRYHTTGRPGMSLLERIVFLADCIEPEREDCLRLNEIRYLAFRDLRRALLLALEDSLIHLQATGREIDPLTQETLTSLREEKEEQ